MPQTFILLRDKYVILCNTVCFRGNTFRAQYKRVTQIRPVLGNVPLLALTATATDSTVRRFIEEFLEVPEFKIISAVPDRFV